MAKRYYFIVIKGKTIIFTGICAIACIILMIICAHFFPRIPLQSISGIQGNVILAMNDLGMHCYQPDYSAF